MISGDMTTTTWSNSNITNGFSIRMSTIGFLFFKFNLKVNVGNVFSSSNNGMTSIMGLGLRVDNWNSIEIFWEGNVNEIFHNIIDSSDNKFSSTS
jgi:hypothetical protein